jgi:hypothetical protein
VYFEGERGGDIMTDKKYLIVAVLATFCLTATLFMIVPTRSQSGLNDYDTWTDVNGDGVIDMADISILIDKYMTSGNTTRDVNVTNFPEDRPLTVKKGIEKITIIDFFSAGAGNGHGIVLEAPGYYFTATFAYDFEPKGQLVNVSDMWVNLAWRGDSAGGHLVLIWFHTYGLGGEDDGFSLSQGIGEPSSIEPIACIVRPPSAFNFNSVRAGMNYLELIRGDAVGAHIYIHNLELYIEYYYWG